MNRLDFVAIDFETANERRSSPCALGIAEVRSGQLISSEVIFVRPPAGHDRLHPFNEALHGISQQVIDRSPPFADVWPLVQARLEGRTVIAHNAAFDVGVLRDTLDVLDAPWPDFEYLCTMVLARRALELDSYRLPFVAEALGVDLGNHHDAGADARAAAEIFLALTRHANATDLETLLGQLHIAPGVLSRNAWRGCQAARIRSGPRSGPKLTAAAASPDADPDHPLFGRIIVFTGALQRMRRQDAWDLCALVGGLPQPRITKKTNVLVVGTQNPRALRPGAIRSSTENKASTLRKGGQDIEILGEDDFLALVADATTSGDRQT